MFKGLTGKKVLFIIIGVIAAILACGVIGDRIAEVIWRKIIADMKFLKEAPNDCT
jgi:hypothetical protein